MNLMLGWRKKELPTKKSHGWESQAAVEMFLGSALDNYAEFLDIPCRDSFILDIAYAQIVRLQKVIEEFEAQAGEPK